MKLIRQHDERDCGAACLAMISSHYGLSLPLSRFRTLTKTDYSGSNIYGLVDGAEQIGLSANALEGTPDELIKEIEAGAIRFPFIAHTVSEQDTLHFVVVAGRRCGKLEIFDPGKGKYTLLTSVFFSRWTGYLVTFEKTPQFKAGKYTSGSLLRFFSLLQGQQKRIIGTTLLSLFIAGIGMAGSFVFKIMLDGKGIASDHTMFNMVFLALIVLYLTQTVMHIIRGWLIAKMARSIDIKLSLSYYRHLLSLPIPDVLSRSTGEYLSRFSDTVSIRNAVSTGTLTLTLDAIMVIVGGILLYLQSPILFAISCGIVVLCGIIALLYRKPLRVSNQNVMESNAVVQSFFKESVDGIETIKAYDANEHIEARFSRSFQRFIQSAFKNSILTTTQDAFVTAIELIGTVIILWVGFSFTFSGILTIGSLMTFYALLAYFTEPIKNLIELQPIIQTAIVAADRLNDVLDSESEQTIEPAPLPRVIAPLTMLNVSFRYGNHELTLKRINLSIGRGEKIAIVGESGCGKTTLAKIIMKFYTPESGEIYLNNRRLEQVERTELCRNIAYVSQNVILFSGTIRSNLLLARPTATEEEMIFACRFSMAHDFITALPLGYDTPLEENGANLSVGQRQRLAIAQAILKKPKMLILDEAASNLDSATEASIWKNIFSYDLELTCIIIAHRLRTINQCKRIIVMKDGVIEEVGSHEELLQKQGLYFDLWQIQ